MSVSGRAWLAAGLLCALGAGSGALESAALASDRVPAGSVVPSGAPSRVFFVEGDSLTVGSAPYLASAAHGAGWSLSGVDAKVGRGVPEGLTRLASARSLPRVVVIALGVNNCAASAAQVRSWVVRASQLVGSSRTVVWVDIDASRPSWCAKHVVAFNAALRAAAAAVSNVRVAGWAAFASRHRLVHTPDGLHYGPAAYRARAWFVADAVRRL